MGQDFLTTKILGIINSRDFYYYACNGCQKKVDRSSNGFRCYKCDLTEATISRKYKLTFTILFNSAIIAVTAFNKLLEKYFGCKACDMLKLLNCLKKLDKGSDGINKILESAIYKVFIGQLFIFQLNSDVTSDFETSTSKISTSKIVKSMHPAINTKPFGTVLYTVLSDLQCIKKPPPIDDYLKNIKSEAQAIKFRANEIRKKFQYTDLDDQEIREEQFQESSATNFLTNNQNDESISFSILMNSTFVHDFFEGSFSFIYHEQDVNPEENICKHKMPEFTNIASNSNLKPPQQNNSPLKQLDPDVNSNILLHLSKSPKLQITPFRLNSNSNFAPHEDSLSESFCTRRWSNLFAGDPHLTSTPSCAQQPTKKRRISEICQSPSISFFDKSCISCHDKEKSVSNIFASNNSSGMHNASESMDLFDATY